MDNEGLRTDPRPHKPTMRSANDVILVQNGLEAHQVVLTASERFPQHHC